MKFKTALIFLFIANLDIGQSKEITKLDGSKISTSKIDSIVEAFMPKANIQGLSVAVLNNNKTVYIKSFGFRNKPRKELLDTSTIVYGASLSKAVFGYLVMKLVQKKIIALDKPLYQYLKKPLYEYEYFSDLKSDDRWKLFTARMCLSHTTGLPNVRWFNPITSEQDSLGIMKIYCTPGTRYAYSGEGFKVLQLAVEETTGKSIEELAIENVFKPMNMTRTGYIWHESFGDGNVAVGHLNNGEIDKKKKRTSPVAGGSLVTTIADYARFTECIMSKKGLHKKFFREMISPQIKIYSKTQFPPVTFETTNEYESINLSYGLGWGLLDCPDGKAIFKEGNGDSWRNYNINFLEKGTAIIILINSENGETVFQELLEACIGKTCIPWQWNGYTPYNSKEK